MPPRKPKEPTKVSLVFEALVRADDFMRTSDVARTAKVSQHHAYTSLHMLKKYKAVEAMEAEGVLWWYATPDADTRTKVVEQRTPEDKPRKRRKANHAN